MDNREREFKKMKCRECGKEDEVGPRCETLLCENCTEKTFTKWKEDMREKMEDDIIDTKIIKYIKDKSIKNKGGKKRNDNIKKED